MPDTLLRDWNIHLVDAAATANLFNFVSGLKNARDFVQQEGVDLAAWPDPEVLNENLAR